MTTPRTRRIIGSRRPLLMIALAMGLVLTLAPQARAATTSSLYNISNSEDNRYNYDFKRKSLVL